MTGMLNWKVGGLVLGLTFFVIFLVAKPIGVSTQFVILDGIVWKIFNKDLVQKDESAKSGYKSTNAYLNKSGGKYAKSVANPINYSYVFVFAMALGGIISKFTKGPKLSANDKYYPEVWSSKYGNKKCTRYIWAFCGGAIVLFGARLAGGCTSGHMMSGMMQTAISGYLFAFGAFLAAVPLAILLYRR